MAGCKINNWVDSALRRFFYKLGYFVGKYPGYFIIVPVMVTALCATGFQRMDYNYDPEYLFSPTGGQAKQERAVVESFFPTNYTQFKASRITRPGKLGRLLVLAKDGGTMLRSHMWNQLLYLDQVGNPHFYFFNRSISFTFHMRVRTYSLAIYMFKGRRFVQGFHFQIQL